MLCCCKIEYDKVLLQKALSFCPQYRLERTEKLIDPKKFAESVTAGALLRFCLKESADDITVSSSGKPYLEGGEYFSLSHSGEYVICSVSDMPIGVDIQQVVSVSDRVIGRFCTEREKIWLDGCRDKSKSAIKLWTLKESYLKASEKGLADVFKSEFAISDSNEVSGPIGYSFSLYESIEGYVVAVCEQLRGAQPL